MKSNLLKKHAKSFYWASFFLSSSTLDKCSSLYNFCRTLDDIVDDDDNNLSLKKEIFLKFKKDFSKYNAEIVGISADNQDSHENFCSEKSINYTLLSDPDGFISDKYGSWIPPFSDRNTFLISPEGEISYRWISVLPINHAKEVLNVLKKKI